MRAASRLILVLSIFAVLAISLPLAAQTVVATIPVGQQPASLALNPATNQTYVANNCGNDSNCRSTGTVTVIDGATFHTQSVNMPYYPYGVAINSATNKIYVANCGTSTDCSGAGQMTVIDGATNGTQNVTVGINPDWIAIDQSRNKIYVLNLNCTGIPCSVQGTMTVIDGTTLTTHTVNVGYSPNSLSVDSTHNKIYVANICGANNNCGTGSVTVIDGATLATQNIVVQITPLRIAVNELTNQIYVINNCGNDNNCRSNGTVSVIDGNSDTVTGTVAVGYYPGPITVNQVTNKIYAIDQCSAAIPDCWTTVPAVTVIDGATLGTDTISVCPSGDYPSDVQVDTVTNQVYMPCDGRQQYGTYGLEVDIMNGATNQVATLAIGNYPSAAAVNAPTNRTYVPNQGDATVSVIGGVPPSALQFVAVPPCRVVDTRHPNGTFGGPPISGGTSRSFPIPQQTDCNIPDSAAAYSLNVTVVPHGTLSYLTIWPTGQAQPVVSTMNSLDGRIKANAAIVPGGYQGAVSVFATNTTDVVLDIDGYFTTPSQQTMAFYPLAPCRVFDTRNADGDLGGPTLIANQPRSFPILEATSCNIPSTAVAYSLNFTAVPTSQAGLGYLTVWPTGQDQPTVSTLNDPTGTIVANAAIVPAGTGGAITVYPNDATNLVSDINGYFAPAGTGGMSFYPVAPCRVIDTRKGNGAFNGALNPPVDVQNSACAPPSSSQAYVFNATVVPNGPLGYLTLWPDGQQRPTVSTLNAIDGYITSNMALVPTSNGKVDAYSSGTTNLVLDLSGYFAP